MATLKEIQKALKADPSLLNKVEGLREFVERNKDEFLFLFSTASSGNAGQPKFETEPLQDKPRKWNPKITKI